MAVGKGAGAKSIRRKRRAEKNCSFDEEWNEPACFKERIRPYSAEERIV